MMKVKVNVKSYPLSTFWQLRRSIFNTLSSPRKVENFVRSGTSRLLKQEQVKGCPTGLLIEPSSYCNMKCPMCARSYMADVQDRGNMSVANFSKLMDDVGRSLLFMIIFGYGEPLMNPDIFEIVRLAKKTGTFVVLGTNGQLLGKERVHEMLENPPDLLLVSLDAVTEKSYQEYRIGGDFNRVLENIKYLSQQRRILGKETPLIDIQFLAMKNNEKELERAENLMRQVAADQFSLKRIASYYTDSNKDKVKDFLPGSADYAYSAYSENRIEPSTFCTYPWRQAAVNWDGTVIPCCKDIDALHPLGNAFDEPLSSIWNNERMQSFRRQIKRDIGAIDICKNCNRRTEKEIYIK